MTMEARERFAALRASLDHMGYTHMLGTDSAPLVDQLLSDILARDEWLRYVVTRFLEPWALHIYNTRVRNNVARIYYMCVMALYVCVIKLHVFTIGANSSCTYVLQVFV